MTHLVRYKCLPSCYHHGELAERRDGVNARRCETCKLMHLLQAPTSTVHDLVHSSARVTHSAPGQTRRFHSSWRFIFRWFLEGCHGDHKLSVDYKLVQYWSNASGSAVSPGTGNTRNRRFERFHASGASQPQASKVGQQSRLVNIIVATSHNCRQHLLVLGSWLCGSKGHRINGCKVKKNTQRRCLSTNSVVLQSTDFAVFIHRAGESTEPQLYFSVPLLTPLSTH